MTVIFAFLPAVHTTSTDIDSTFGYSRRTTAPSLDARAIYTPGNGSFYGLLHIIVNPCV
jgi:hypothetical protein